MATLFEVKVPDIGDFTDVPVIEVLVKPGDAIKNETALVTLESDKATMDVPSPVDGVVKDIKVKLGDKVSQGSVILTLEGAQPASPEKKPAPEKSATTVRSIRTRPQTRNRGIPAASRNGKAQACCRRK